MIPLPIDSILPSLTEVLRAHRAAVLVAPPGAGKTTRVPVALLRAGLLAADHPNLVMLQPRRVAARASAERIAQENAWTLGREVGYHIRFDRKLTDQTRLRILTEGILTRQLLAHPFLEGVGAVVLDEFHERHLDTDLAVAFLKEIRQTVRPDLLILVMSATIEAQPVARFLGNCPIVQAQGRTFPLEMRYANNTAGPRELPDRIAAALQEASAKFPADFSADPDHVLVFLPGMEEIRRTMRRLEPLAQQLNADVLPLHGSLPSQQQHAALAPSARRKIILATNIAETSLTIDGVRTVIDGGYARLARYDARRGLDRLDLERISQASADQRAGRAGRTAPGRVWRLWTQKQHHALPLFTEPEILRVDLARTILALYAWGSADPRTFEWYETPPQQAIASAGQLLEMLGAVQGANVDGAKPRLTPLGRQMLRLPLHPRIARLLIASAQRQRLEDGCAMAALLSEKDILSRTRMASHEPANMGASDLLHRLALLQQPHSPQVDHRAARQVSKTQHELMRIGRRLSTVPLNQAATPCPPPERDVALRQALLLAYPDRVCRRRASDPNTAAIVGGGAVRLARESIVRRGEFFLALDARHDPASPTRQVLVHLASALEPQWLEEFFPEQIRREQTAVYDEKRDRVIGLNRLLYRDLSLREETGTAVEDARALEILMSVAAPMAQEIFRGDPAADQLLNRLAFLRKHGLQLELSLTDALRNLAVGKRSLEQLRRADLAQMLLAAIPYQSRQMLDRQAPPSITLPTGRQWRLTYSPDASPPVLAVKLQELFGVHQTPRVAGGRVAVVLHLLAPNGRPVQITNDLASFWTNTYPQVRKDLRGRYPKHKWPEKP